MASRTRARIGLPAGRTITASTSRHGKVLLVAQVALSLVLLFGAGLFAKSLASLRSIDVGFRSTSIVWGRAAGVPGQNRGTPDEAYYAELIRQLQHLPGVQSVALSRLFPAYFNVTIPPVVFRPLLHEPRFMAVPDISVRAVGEADAVGEAMRSTVAGFGRQYIRGVQTIDREIDRTLLQERLLAWLSACCAGLAVLLASIGVYGLLAYTVARRTAELGVRMALGASRGTVMTMIVREGLVLTSIGVAIGIPCALAISRTAASLLFGLTPSDPITLAAAALCFVVIGALAGVIPARRASTVDPMIALRAE